MKNKKYAVLFALIMPLAACTGGLYKDGVWLGASGPDDRGAYGEVTVTVKDGGIADCVFITRQKDGTAKDENYGKVNGEISNQDFYDKAQFAVRAMGRYAEQFKAAKSFDGVDAISGATIAYEQFLEAAENALEKAKK